MLYGFHYDLAIDALQRDRQRPVLFLDGAHVLNGYDFAEYNILHGLEAEDGIHRVLTCRVMTPFQWGKALTMDLHDQLDHHQPSLVVASGFNVQFDKDDLVDWEQEDYVRSTLAMMRRLARIHKVPLVLTLDLARWSRTHPTAARLVLESGIDILRVDWQRGWGLTSANGAQLVEQQASRGTLDAWLPNPAPPLEIEA